MSTEKKSVWSIVLKVIVAVATTLAGVFGISSCISR
ncbi:MULTISPECIES: smalltalk protein [Bacteroides]|nr:MULTISPECIES: smalltalk protein [Bacteroides]